MFQIALLLQLYITAVRHIESGGHFYLDISGETKYNYGLKAIC